ncbi:hypothetical protein SAMN04488074_1361, partial [Lentzea albidocapillata subsp. violacea]
FSVELDIAIDAQERLRGEIEAAWEGGDVDPLIGELANAAAQIRAAEKRRRLLLAYAREFVEPRPYTLDTLAKAASMSVSGVRTAYDDEEIYVVAKRIGAKLRRREEPAASDGPDFLSNPAADFFAAASAKTGRPEAELAAEFAKGSVAGQDEDKTHG